MLDALQPSFPPSLKTVVAFDTTPFVRVAIGNVVETLPDTLQEKFLSSPRLAMQRVAEVLKEAR